MEPSESRPGIQAGLHIALCHHLRFLPFLPPVTLASQTREPNLWTTMAIGGILRPGQTPLCSTAFNGSNSPAKKFTRPTSSRKRNATFSTNDGNGKARIHWYFFISWSPDRTAPGGISPKLIALLRLAVGLSPRTSGVSTGPTDGLRSRGAV